MKKHKTQADIQRNESHRPIKDGRSQRVEPEMGQVHLCPIFQKAGEFFLRPRKEGALIRRAGFVQPLLHSSTRFLRDIRPKILGPADEHGAIF
jgi:hypothetical protein